MDRLVPLQDHVVLEEVTQAQPFGGHGQVAGTESQGARVIAFPETALSGHHRPHLVTQTFLPRRSDRAPGCPTGVQLPRVTGASIRGGRLCLVG